MTGLHLLTAEAVLVASLVLLAAASWSVVAARASGGRRDHRFAVDRAILIVTAVLAIAGLAGVAVAIGGGRPADPLHLVYGPAALAVPAAGRWLGGRSRAGAGTAAERSRRDAWLVVASVLLLGIELRLAMTG
jgi:hypothetical protein